MLLMKIRRISDDPDNYCLSVSLSILPGLNADNAKSKSAEYGNIFYENCVNAQQAV